MRVGAFFRAQNSTATQIATAKTDQNPSTCVRTITEQAEIYAPVFAIAKIEHRRQHVNATDAGKLHHVDHHIFADLVDRKGHKACPERSSASDCAPVVAEVAHAGEDHRQARLISRCNHFVVTH